jgi:NAD(P)-dependent dehydrogenase (short-subunit alcohol dehydrogenase family)
MKDKICMITGASDGIGKAAALALAKAGVTIILVCRNRERGEDTLSWLIHETGNESHSLMLANLASFHDIRVLAGQFNRQFNHLDILINNAGLFTTSLEYTEDGIELQFAVNHLAPFLLTNLLMAPLLAAANARVINVSSVSHRFGLLFTYELARRLKESSITVNAVNPGRVNTNIVNKKARGIYRWLWNLNKPFLISPGQGAGTIVYLATAPELEHVTGRYFYKCRERKSSRLSYREDLAKKLWDTSAILTSQENVSLKNDKQLI